MALAGLRERKKQQTRKVIFDAAQRLFTERGFEAVTVAEIARGADVSEVTVFNYFPTKEDLFYGGMQVFEEGLFEAVRSRRRGEPATAAFRRHLLDSAENLSERNRAATIAKAAKIISASPSLLAREREIADRYVRRFAALLAEESGAAPDDVESIGVASALMGTHRATVDFVRRRVLAGIRGPQLADEYRAQARRAFSRLERGLGNYAIKS